MRRYQALLLFALAFQSLPAFGTPKKKELPPPPPYDFDLFHKDLEVWFGSAELRYWTVNEGALDYAQKMKQPAWSPTASYASGTVQNASYNLDPGVRVGVGYFNAPKYWIVQAEYTHFITRGKNSAEKPEASDEFLTGTWPQITTNPLVHAHSN